MNIINDWLNEHGDKKIEEKVKLILSDVVGQSEKFVCDKHPNARTYTSTTGRHCCVKCVMG